MPDETEISLFSNVSMIEKPVSSPIPVKKVIDKRNLFEDVELRAGDIGIVRKTWIAKVEPFVKLTNLGSSLHPAGF